MWKQKTEQENAGHPCVAQGLPCDKEIRHSLRLDRVKGGPGCLSNRCRLENYLK